MSLANRSFPETRKGPHGRPRCEPSITPPPARQKAGSPPTRRRPPRRHGKARKGNRSPCGSSGARYAAVRASRTPATQQVRERRKPRDGIPDDAARAFQRLDNLIAAHKGHLRRRRAGPRHPPQRRRAAGRTLRGPSAYAMRGHPARPAPQDVPALIALGPKTREGPQGESPLRASTARIRKAPSASATPCPPAAWRCSTLGEGGLNCRVRDGTG